MLAPEILRDLADQTGQACGRLPPDFAQKMVRRLRRKFKIRLEAEVVAQSAVRYQAIYQFASAALKDCLRPSQGPYANLADIDDPKYMARLKQQFPDEDEKILDLLAGWVIQYEYLR